MKKMVVSAAVFLLAVFFLSATGVRAAGNNTPPDVRLDPDRGMTFDRIPKTTIDGGIYKPFKDSMKWRLMDPDHDPYRSMLQSERYDPSTGRIHGGLSDKVREMRRGAERRR
jgi:hypothetical protein